MPTAKAKTSPGNLPMPLSTFIGRERELADVRQLLSAHRLVTLTGAGGSGKTRLSLRIAGDLQNTFVDGAWFVELASLSDAALIPQTIASTLHIREGSGQALVDALIDFLSAREVLLVLDNCEHLIAACATMTETLLQTCPRLKVLATSREVLGISGEVAWTVRVHGPARPAFG
jgi:predicted ATPase